MQWTHVGAMAQWMGMNAVECSGCSGYNLCRMNAAGHTMDGVYAVAHECRGCS